MDILKGSIVRARAGRDKGEYFVVLGFDGEFALITNGKQRKVEKPKKKSLKHLQPTKTILNLQQPTNHQIKKILNEFNGIQNVGG